MRLQERARPWLPLLLAGDLPHGRVGCKVGSFSKWSGDAQPCPVQPPLSHHFLGLAHLEQCGCGCSLFFNCSWSLWAAGYTLSSGGSAGLAEPRS